MDKSSILKVINSVKPELVEVPEWATSVYLRSLSIGDWLEIADMEDTKTLFVVLEKAIVDEDGNAVFVADDLIGMPDTQTAVLTRLFNIVKPKQDDIEDAEKK